MWPPSLLLYCLLLDHCYFARLLLEQLLLLSDGITVVSQFISRRYFIKQELFYIGEITLFSPLVPCSYDRCCCVGRGLIITSLSLHFLLIFWYLVRKIYLVTLNDKQPLFSIECFDATAISTVWVSFILSVVWSNCCQIISHQQSILHLRCVVVAYLCSYQDERRHWPPDLDFHRWIFLVNFPSFKYYFYRMLTRSMIG